MTATVLRVDGLGKAFRTYGSEWSRVLSWFGVAPNILKEQWVLRNIGFRVAPGEAVARPNGL